jgi:hypothetical protein
VAFQAKIESLPEGDVRASGRQRLLLRSSVDVGEGRRIEAVIRDISLTGFLLELDAELRPDSEVSVEITEGETRFARVVWISGKLHGCTFEQPISRSDLKKVQAASRVIWPQFSNLNEGPHLRSRERATDHNAVPSQAKLATTNYYDLSEDSEQEVSHSLSAGQRLQIIFGLAALTWAVIGAIAWLLLR